MIILKGTSVNGDKSTKVCNHAVLRHHTWYPSVHLSQVDSSRVKVGSLRFVEVPLPLYHTVDQENLHKLIYFGGGVDLWENISLGACICPELRLEFHTITGLRGQLSTKWQHSVFDDLNANSVDTILWSLVQYCYTILKSNYVDI